MRPQIRRITSWNNKQDQIYKPKGRKIAEKL